VKVILFTSGAKGGTGKTTIALNVAIILSYELRDKAQYPVTLVDLGLDSGTASMLLMGNPEAVPQYSLSDYFMGRVPDPLSVFYVKTWQVSNEEFRLVFTASFGGGGEVARMDGHLLRGLINAARAISPEYVIIDSPATGLSSESLVHLLSSSTYVVLVMSPDHSSIRSAQGVVRIMDQLEGKPRLLKPILNMLDSRHPVDVVTGSSWVDVVRRYVGVEPHVIPYDELFLASRQALEIESLKLTPIESPALSSIFKYVDYLYATLGS